MEINEAVSIVRTTLTGIQAVKAACNAVPVGAFQPTRKKLAELKEQIIDLEAQVNSGFPKLKQLILSYSEINKDVAIARALSEKASEIIKLAPSIASVYVVALISPTQAKQNDINSKIRQLPALDTAEAGALTEKLNRVDILIRDLQKIIAKGGTEGVESNAIEVAEIFYEISRNYAGVESKLSELLNNKILNNFDLPRS